MDNLGYIAIDQHGSIYHIGNNPPRKWLFNYLGRQHADKIYCDTKDGRTRHVGYIIAGHWLTVYRIKHWKWPDKK